MAKRFLRIPLVLILGGCSCYLFMWFLGFISQYTVHLIMLTSNIPRPYRIHVYWLSLLIEWSLIALPVVASVGITLGRLTKKHSLFNAALAFVGFACFYLYCNFILYDIGLVGPIWLNLSKALIILILLIYTTSYGYSFRIRRLNMANE